MNLSYLTTFTLSLIIFVENFNNQYIASYHHLKIYTSFPDEVCLHSNY